MRLTTVGKCCNFVENKSEICKTPMRKMLLAQGHNYNGCSTCMHDAERQV